MSTVSPAPATSSELATVLARLATLEAHATAREERNRLLEEENRWLKAQLFGRSSEKTPREQINPDQAWLFNQAESLAHAAEAAFMQLDLLFR
jgi:ribosome modulation factor